MRWQRVSHYAFVTCIGFCVAFLVVGGLAYAATPSPSPEPITPPAQINTDGNLQELALVITAVFAGISAVIGAVAQLIQSRTKNTGPDAEDLLQAELLRQLLIERGRQRQEDDDGQ